MILSPMIFAPPVAFFRLAIYRVVVSAVCSSNKSDAIVINFKNFVRFAFNCSLQILAPPPDCKLRWVNRLQRKLLVNNWTLEWSNSLKNSLNPEREIFISFRSPKTKGKASSLFLSVLYSNCRLNFCSTFPTQKSRIDCELAPRHIRYSTSSCDQK